jgi:hypothetical protein
MQIFGEVKLNEKELIRIFEDDFNGKKYLNIREMFWSPEGGRFLYSKKGISFKKEDWKDFMLAMGKFAVYLEETNYV